MQTKWLCPIEFMYVWTYTHMRITIVCFEHNPVAKKQHNPVEHNSVAAAQKIVEYFFKQQFRHF